MKCILYFLSVCVEDLRPIQPIGIMFSAISLRNPSWARPAILVAGEGTGGLFIIIIISSVSSLSFMFLLLPCPSLSSPLLYLPSLFSLYLGDDTKWPTRVDVSLNQILNLPSERLTSIMLILWPENILYPTTRQWSGIIFFHLSCVHLSFSCDDCHVSSISLILYQPGHSVSYTIACAPSESSDQPARQRSWSEFAVRLRTLDPWLSTECLARILIRLCGCAS